MSVPKLSGLETEFAITGGELFRICEQVVSAYRRISLHPAGGIAPDSPGGANPCCAYGAGADLMLPNGARYYVDHAHPEYSTPESVDPVNIVALDRAGAEIVRRCAEAASQGQTERIRIYKNNSDHRGRSYGCHENYLMDAGAYAALFGERSDLIFDYLIPFLASRIVFTGAGKVGAEPEDEAVVYQLSQRADFFEELVGLQTTYRRPIVNTRDESHADPARFRRLHVIAGDANMCPYAAWLKLGTMQIVLRMVEDGAMGRALRLANPIEAVRRISRDVELEKRIHLEGGRELSAIEIQMEFLSYAQRYFSRYRPSDAEQNIMTAWEGTLFALRKAPLLLVGKLDWVTKRQIITELASQGGWDRHDPRFYEADIKYHALDPKESLFASLERAGLITYPIGWNWRLVDRYLQEPPDDSRAYLRGGCIARYSSQITGADWEEVRFDVGRLSMPDPLAMGRSATQAILEQTTTPAELLEALDSVSGGN